MATTDNPLNNIVVMYMAQVPLEPWVPDHIHPTYPTDKIIIPPAVSSETEAESNQLVQKLERLLEAIFNLKTGNAEIYRLKALAWEIKHGETDASNDPR